MNDLKTYFNFTIEISPIIYGAERKILRELIECMGVSTVQLDLELKNNGRNLYDALDTFLSDDYVIIL